MEQPIELPAGFAKACRDTAAEVAGLFRSAAYRHQRWIPVSERLPERAVAVLAFAYGYGTQVAFITADKDHEWWYWGTSGCMGFNPTHWMPLPEPPTASDPPPA